MSCVVITLSQIKQNWRRQLWKYLCKNMKNIHKWKYIYWIELKTLWEKEKLFVLSIFSFCHKVFLSHWLQSRPKESVWGKGLNLESCCVCVHCTVCVHWGRKNQEKMVFRFKRIIKWLLYDIRMLLNFIF